jgi:hypothetical protein
MINGLSLCRYVTPETQITPMTLLRSCRASAWGPQCIEGLITRLFSTMYGTLSILQLRACFNTLVPSLEYIPSPLGMLLSVPRL